MAHSETVSPTFNSLISEKLAGLGDELIKACGNLANEQGARLREENQRLRRENEALRVELQRVNGQGSSTVTCIDNVELLETSPDVLVIQENRAISLASFPSSFDKDAKEFRLLAELSGSKWDQNGLSSASLDLHDCGYHHREEPTLVAMTRFLLDPSHNHRLCWDCLGIPILAWDLITIPMQVFDMGSIAKDVFSVADWATLLYWTLDIPASFMTGFYDSEGDVVMEFIPIAKNYIHGHFGLDLFIIGADWVSVFIEFIGSDSPSFLQNFAILRVLRISRFARLLRLRKLKERLQEVEDMINDEYHLVLVDLVVKILAVIVVNHYIGCIWYWIGDTAGFGGSDYRWLTALPYPQYDADKYGDQKMSDATWHYKYSTCLHWSLAQITPGPNNIQPQNTMERIYAVCILLFGMVVFSSFVAAVTQARMQMAKALSKFDREYWLLRKFCRQHNTTLQFQARIKRYVDYVLVPAQTKLSLNDLSLVPKLSPHLRLQLNKEIFSQALAVHPFFHHLTGGTQSVIAAVCSLAIENMSLARGDVAFVSGQMARCMFLVTEGFLDYLPISKNYSEEMVEKGTWVSEACLWTTWMHQGQMQASIETRVMTVEGAKLRDVLVKNGLVMAFVQQYGIAFCRNMSKALQDRGMPSDLQAQFALNIDISSLPNAAGSFLWFGNPLGT